MDYCELLSEKIYSVYSSTSTRAVGEQCRKTRIGFKPEETPATTGSIAYQWLPSSGVSG